MNPGFDAEFSAMTSEIPNDEAVLSDARSLALLLINRFGERAVSHASHQSLKASWRGDSQSAAQWRRVAEVTEFLLRSEVETVDAR